MNDLTGMESRIVKEIQEPEHFHPEIEVIYVIDGKLKMHIKGMSYDLAKDDVILINSGLMHETKSAEGTLLCVVNYSCRLLASLMTSWAMSNQFWKAASYRWASPSCVPWVSLKI